MSADHGRLAAVLDFWLGEAAHADDVDSSAFEARTKFWFMRNPDTDREIRERFQADVERAAASELDSAADDPLRRVALIILLDQFPRNLFREAARAFATDGRAREIATGAIDAGEDRILRVAPRFMLYMPLMHAEDCALQQQAVALFTRLRDEAPPVLRPELGKALDFAARHKTIIDRFGRFPHRNRALGRASTPEEEAFLKEPGSSF